MFKLLFNFSHTKIYNKGYTLIETLAVIAIFAILMIVLVEFYIGFNRSSTFVQAKMDVANAAGTITNDISKTIKQANQVVTSHVFSGTNYTSSSTVLVLELPSIDNSGSIITSTYDYVVFFVQGMTAYQIIDANNSSSRISSQKQLGDNVQSLSYTFDNQTLTSVKKIDINIQTQKLVRNQTIQSSLEQQVYLRNK